MCIIIFESYVVAHVFAGLSDITSVTLLQCLYADMDICKQLSRDEYEGTHRPKEMAHIVKCLKK